MEKAKVFIERSVTFQKQTASIRVTEDKIVIVQYGRPKLEVPFTAVQGFQRSKWRGGEPTEKSITKLRIIHSGGSPIDVAFTGVNCQNKLDAVLVELKNGQKRCTEPERNESADEDDATEVKRNPLLESVVMKLVKDGTLREEEVRMPERDEVDGSAVMEEIGRAIRGNVEVATAWRKWMEEHQNEEYPDGISPSDANRFLQRYREWQCASTPLGPSKQEDKSDASIFLGLEGSVRTRQMQRVEGRRPLLQLPVEEVAEGTALEIPASREMVERARDMNARSEYAVYAIESEADDEGYGEDSIDNEDSLCSQSDVEHRWSGTACSQEEVTDCGSALADVINEYASEFEGAKFGDTIPAEDVDDLIREITTQKVGIETVGRLADTAVFAKAMKRIRRHKLEQLILLHNFWANVESESPERQEKAAKLKDKLRQLKDMMDHEKSNFRNPQIAKYMIPLYEEMDDAFEKALASRDH